MHAYRTRATDPHQIALVVGGATFPRRLLSTLHASRSLFVMLMVIVLLFSTLFGIALGSAEDLMWALLVMGVMLFGPVLIVLAIRSLLPGPNEVLLPRELLLREGGIEVLPRSGPSFEARWTWIAGARETQASFVLLLCMDPRLEVVVKKSILLAEQRALLGRWLREHKILRSAG